jgi:hypothetical protein
LPITTYQLIGQSITDITKIQMKVCRGLDLWFYWQDPEHKPLGEMEGKTEYTFIVGIEIN